MQQKTLKYLTPPEKAYSIKRTPSISTVKLLPRLKKEVLKIVILSSYPPTECGIASFTYDLETSLKNKFGNSINISICALETGTSSPGHLKQRTLNTASKIDYACVVQEINSDKDLDLVMIQHEFGLFTDNESSFIELLRSISKPIALTFHTVLPNPDGYLLGKVESMVESVDLIIVMTTTSANIMVNDYGVEKEKITVIPHGTHLVPHRDQMALKIKYKLAHKKVLSTFGLIGPGKSIETTLNAMFRIVKDFPDVVFLIIGKTHPSLLKSEGEKYRNMLKAKIVSLGLDNHVHFINKFLPLNELLEYLQLTDVYLFTSKDPNQAVSGTFSYALSCGCPIVSTPIPHAVELFRKEACTLFDFGNSEQLYRAVSDLLKPEAATQRMILNGLHFTSKSAWENIAIAHGKVIQKLARRKVDLQFALPPMKLSHIKKMTTGVGIIQFSKFDEPDIESGYTVDDNARALICICKHYQLTNDPEDLGLIKTYFNFIFRCLRCNGKFLNYVDKNKQFTSQNNSVNLEDANGRAIWAVGYFLSISKIIPIGFKTIINKAEQIFEEVFEQVESIKSPRALAFIIKGLFYYGKTGADTSALISILADRILRMYQHQSTADWKWFENSLTYGNAVMPQALLLAFQRTGKKQYQQVAKESFDFLLSILFSKNSIHVISNNGWLGSGELSEKGQGGEQPIDVAYTILALASFHNFFPDAGYDCKLKGAFNWFLGDNSLNQTIYNPCTGGCYDGIEKHCVNLNQGAESTISYLLARMVLESENYQI